MITAINNPVPQARTTHMRRQKIQKHITNSALKAQCHSEAAKPYILNAFKIGPIQAWPLYIHPDVKKQFKILIENPDDLSCESAIALNRVPAMMNVQVQDPVIVANLQEFQSLNNPNQTCVWILDVPDALGYLGYIAMWRLRSCTFITADALVSVANALFLPETSRIQAQFIFRLLHSYRELKMAYPFYISTPKYPNINTIPGGARLSCVTASEQKYQVQDILMPLLHEAMSLDNYLRLSIKFSGEWVKTPEEIIVALCDKDITLSIILSWCISFKVDQVKTLDYTEILNAFSRERKSLPGLVNFPSFATVLRLMHPQDQWNIQHHIESISELLYQAITGLAAVSQLLGKKPTHGELADCICRMGNSILLVPKNGPIFQSIFEDYLKEVKLPNDVTAALNINRFLPIKDHLQNLLIN